MATHTKYTHTERQHVYRIEDLQRKIWVCNKKIRDYELEIEDLKGRLRGKYSRKHRQKV